MKFLSENSTMWPLLEKVSRYAMVAMIGSEINDILDTKNPDQVTPFNEEEAIKRIHEETKKMKDGEYDDMKILLIVIACLMLFALLFQITVRVRSAIRKTAQKDFRLGLELDSRA